jgi:hypothetical protein
VFQTLCACVARRRSAFSMGQATDVRLPSALTQPPRLVQIGFSQPLDVSDAAQRLAFLALSEPASRPLQAEYDQPTAASSSTLVASSNAAAALSSASASSGPRMRTYDAVGPETMTLLDMLKFFARLNGNTLRPVFVDYRNFEKVQAGGPFFGTRGWVGLRLRAKAEAEVSLL